MRLCSLLLLLAACGGADPDPDKDGPTAEATVCPGDEAGPTELTILPYLQSVEPSSAWILWETPNTATGSRVEFGPTEALGQVACGDVVWLNPESDPVFEASAVHEVELTGLSAGQTVYYRVLTGETASPIAHFKTPEDSAAEASIRVVAMGDSQQDFRLPDKYREVVQDGIESYVEDNFGPDLSEELSMVLFAGDLVDNGWLREQWVDDFFAPSAELFGQVPLYPVPGNHEGNSPHYDRYMHLPGNEHYYTVDRSNVRVVSLDSNGPWDNQDQLVWLEGVLDQTCSDPTIDFVFAQLHHPALSELWTPGESDWSAEVVARLELFSTDCGKPSLHMFGHTHGYSRGQSQSHQHLWINVSSAGGALDRWGEQPQADYPEFVASQDTYGFVLVEVEAGDHPQFTVSRVSRGTPEEPVDNPVTDQLTIRVNNAAPSAPIGEADPSDPCSGPVALAASAFADPDGGTHQGTHWQVATGCDSFDSPLVDRWMQSTNSWMGVDTQAGDDLTDEVFPELSAGQHACWRVRYRDEGLVWSDWSAPVAISLPSCP